MVNHVCRFEVDHPENYIYIYTTVVVSIVCVVSNLLPIHIYRNDWEEDEDEKNG